MLVLSEPLIAADAARSLLMALAPEWKWLIGQIKSERGNFRFPRLVTDIIRNLRIECYPLLYENEASIGGVVLRGFMDEVGVRQLSRELAEATPKERGQLLLDAVREADKFVNQLQIPKTGAEEEKVRKAFEALPPEDQEESVKLGQRLMMAFLASFYQTLSVMVHGEKLTALVSQPATINR